jgi:hypothetical protein
MAKDKDGITNKHKVMMNKTQGFQRGRDLTSPVVIKPGDARGPKQHNEVPKGGGRPTHHQGHTDLVSRTGGDTG